MYSYIIYDYLVFLNCIIINNFYYVHTRFIYNIFIKLLNINNIIVNRNKYLILLYYYY